MNIQFRRAPSGMVLLALYFLCSGCTLDNKQQDSLDPLYKQALFCSTQGDYLKALALYNKALALDTLHRASPRVVKALNEKRVIEGLTGEYYAALNTTARMEKLPAGMLPDSLRNTLFTDQATWLCELGSFGAAVASLEHIVVPSPARQLQQASLYQKSGEVQKSVRIYRHLLIEERDPVTRITAYAGLLRCKVAHPELGIEKPDLIAGKIAAESKRVFAMEGAVERRIQALRVASQTLQLFEKHRSNASFFLFKALALAEKSRNPLLLQIIRMESNAVILRKPDTYREAAEYFRINNMQYAQAISLFLLAGSQSINDEDRIRALQQGFSVSRYFAPPYPTNELLQLEKKSERRLTGLLLEKSRIFELFDAVAEAGNHDLERTLQIYRKRFSLGKGHEALEAEVAQLQHEISGLLQRKADMLNSAEGYEKNRNADQALNIKRGRLIELIPEVRVINPVAAEAMQLMPVTLRKLQASLKEDQAIIKPLLSDSLCGVMLIGKMQLQIAKSNVCFDVLHTPGSKIDAIRRELAASSSGRQESAAEGEWFAKAFYEPIAGSLAGYKHLMVLCDALFPYHVLSSGHNSLPEKRYSVLPSITEFSLLSEHPKSDAALSRIMFYRADNVMGARLQKLFFPRDRVFLLWKNYSSTELEALRQQIGQEMERTVSGSEALLSLGRNAAAGRELWINISSYGID